MRRRESKRRDELRLRDVLDHIDSALAAVAGKSRSEFDADTILQKAVLHDLSIIGEAAGRVSLEVQTKHTEVPWKRISDARNFIQHEYFSLDLDIIWQTISSDLAPLRSQIDEILKTEFPGETSPA